MRGWGNIDVWGRLKLGYDVVQVANAPVGSLALSDVTTGEHGGLAVALIEPRGTLSTDGPSHVLAGYRLALQVTDASGQVVGGSMVDLPDITPGDSTLEVPVAWTGADVGVEARLSLLSPTGFEVAVADVGLRAPAAPQVTHTVVANESVRVHFNDPASVRLYLVEATDASGDVVASVETAEAFADLTGLTNDVEYTISVVAQNSFGPSEPDEVTAVPAAGLAMAPKVVNLASVDRGLVLGFSDGTTNAEFEVSVTDVASGDEVQLYTTDNRPGTRIENLTLGIEYDVKIRRLSSGGPASAWSEPLRGTALGTSSDPELTVHGAIAGTTSAGIVITPSEGTERYLISVSGPGVDRSYSIERAAIDLLPIDDLSAGASFDVSVRAQSATGLSDAWNGTIQTREDAPDGDVDVPTDLEFGNRGDDVFLSWNPGSDTPVDGYLVTRFACNAQSHFTVVGSELGIGTLGQTGGSYTVAAIRGATISSPTASIEVPGSQSCVFVVTPDDTEARVDSSLPFSTVGTWSVSSLLGPGGYASLYTLLSSSSEATAVWTSPTALGGLYRIEVGIPDSYGADSIYTVAASTGDVEIEVDQSEEAGTWVDLGEFDFADGQRATVTLSSGSTGYMRASAVRFVPLVDAESPSIPAPVLVDQTVSVGDPIQGTGTVSGNALVLMTRDGVELGSGVVGADLSWSITPAVPLTPGIMNGVIIVETAAVGWSGEDTATLTVLDESGEPGPTGPPDTIVTPLPPSEFDPSLELPVGAVEESSDLVSRTMTVTLDPDYASEWVFAVFHSTAPGATGQSAAGWFLVSESGVVEVEVPAGVSAGQHTLALYDANGVLIAFAESIEISELAFTGASPIASLVTALLFLLAGAGFIVVRRRRSASGHRSTEVV